MDDTGVLASEQAQLQRERQLAEQLEAEAAAAWAALAAERLASGTAAQQLQDLRAAHQVQSIEGSL